QPAPTADALTAVYEPGSVMKLPTYAAVLTRGIAAPSTPISVPANLPIDGSIFHDAETHPAETLTLSQCLAQSSNICTIEMAQKLGKQGLYNSLHAFGFGRAQGLNFPGMSPGLLNPPSRWSRTALASTAIGQDEGVDLLQIADAYDVVANQGVSVPPRLVEATIDANGSRHPVPLARGQRIVSPEIARTLVSMLEGVVSTQGTAPAAAIPGYTVAGKTGTASIPNPRGSGYLPGAFNATFVGFVPAQQPAITVVVRLANPNVFYGGSAAAPVAARVMSYALRILAIPPPQGTVNQGAPADVSNNPGTAPGLPNGQ
ncbi:MAG: peptidoglycan D,D-transpeptidase FtsI family protein, partial [Acidimicrobiales bacterium]